MRLEARSERSGEGKERSGEGKERSGEGKKRRDPPRCGRGIQPGPGFEAQRHLVPQRSNLLQIVDLRIMGFTGFIGGEGCGARDSQVSKVARDAAREFLFEHSAFLSQLK